MHVPAGYIAQKCIEIEREYEVARENNTKNGFGSKILTKDSRISGGMLEVEFLVRADSKYTFLSRT